MSYNSYGAGVETLGKKLSRKGREVTESPLMTAAIGAMVLTIFILVILIAVGIIDVATKPVTLTSRFGQPAVGLLDQRAAGPDRTRLDGANQGNGTYDAPLGTPEYSDEAAQVASAQLAKAKAGFRSRFYNSRANGPSPRYVPFTGAENAGASPAPAPAAATERMATNQDQKLLAAMGGR